MPPRMLASADASNAKEKLGLSVVVARGTLRQGPPLRWGMHSPQTQCLPTT